MVLPVGTVVAIALMAPSVIAAPGDVDTTFGHEGLVTLQGLKYPYVGAVDFAFQKTGRIVYASTTWPISGCAAG